MSVDTENFIIATFALWAGDFEYAESLLSRYSKAAPLNGAVESVDDLIRRTGGLRLRQLRQKKGEFKQLAGEYDSSDPVQANPAILETKHLRGALWRLGTREFNLCAYLKDFSWQENLLDLANHEATLHESSEEPMDQRGYRLPFQGHQQSKTNLGVAWTVTGSLLLRVQISDLCLLEANGMWTEARLPSTDEEIKEPFFKLLYALDPHLVKNLTKTGERAQ